MRALVLEPPIVAPAPEWHVCPVCGLAGLAKPGFSYCRLHGDPGPETLNDRQLTEIEIRLGRVILREPPRLGDWIKRFGGYANITAEGWAEYDAAMAKWREAKS
jgi:hypothetical protein